MAKRHRRVVAPPTGTPPRLTEAEAARLLGTGAAAKAAEPGERRESKRPRVARSPAQPVDPHDQWLLDQRPPHWG